jgi:hypothetical protein
MFRRIRRFFIFLALISSGHAYGRNNVGPAWDKAREIEEFLRGRP